MTRPLARTRHLDGLANATPGSDFPADWWAEVHEQVQAQLARLESEVRRRLPGVCVVCGRTRGDRFYLFSNRTFSLPQSDLDPVVSGVTFTPAGQGVAVEADVSGERSGDCLFSIPRQAAAKTREAVLAAVGEVARRLCGEAEAITAALQDAARVVEEGALPTSPDGSPAAINHTSPSRE